MNVPDNMSLVEKFQWLQANAQSDGEYTIAVTSDESIGEQTLSFPDKSNVTVRLAGEGEKTISLAGEGSLFKVEAGVTLILDSGVTLQGHKENSYSLVLINGTMIMNAGAKIKGNSSALFSAGGITVFGTFNMIGGEISDNESGDGGGVGVIGEFTMSGGEISGNSGHNHGGGVFVSGTFTMTGGKISGNKASNGGSGVRVAEGGNFIMSDGEISKNTAKYGGGVFTNGIFTMTGGKISGNKASQVGGGVFLHKDGAFTMKNGEICENIADVDGGGVHIHEASGMFMEGGKISNNISYCVGGGVTVIGNFTMEDGVISDNKAKSFSRKKSAGGGVDVAGTFTMKGGKISGNTADLDTQVNVERTGHFDKIGGEVISGSSSSGCYIATAVYGSYDAPEVLCLRQFRDEVLAPSVFGCLFITLYYRFSPPIAERLKNAGRINMFVRKTLDKFVEILANKGGSL